MFKVPMPFSRTNGLRDFIAFASVATSTVGGALALFF